MYQIKGLLAQRERILELEKRVLELEQRQVPSHLPNELVQILSLLVEHLSEGIIVTNPEGKIIHVNPAGQKLSGYSYDELIGHFPGILNGEESSEQIQSQIIEHVQQGRRWQGEILQKRKNGTPYLGGFEIFPIYQPDGTVLAWTSIQRDVTRLKQAQEKFSKVFNTCPLPMSINQLSTHQYIDINPSFVQTLGYQREEVIGHTCEELGVFLDSERAQNCMQILDDVGVVYNYECAVKTKGGHVRKGLVSAQILEHLGEKYAIWIFSDLTEIQELQKELTRLERLQLVGQMAAGIGHEIRNPITSVRGFLQLFQAKEGFRDHQEHIVLMIDELDRANAIITEFLSLTKKEASDLERCDLNQILMSLCPLLESNALNREQYVSMDLHPIPKLWVNQREIRQLVLNLVQNGLYAMGKGGQLTIRTHLVEDQVILAVADQGTGIPADILGHLGTPFLTTRPEGTGLGLAICYSIADRHRATVEVDTNSQGTAFSIKFKVRG